MMEAWAKVCTAPAGSVTNIKNANSCVVADMNGDGRRDLVCMDGWKPNYIK